MNVVSIEQGGSGYLSKLIIDLMLKEKVDHKYYIFTNYLNIVHRDAAIKEGFETIYLSHDSESKVFDHRGWQEAEHLYKIKPGLIITVSPIAKEFYEQFGLNTYYLPLGYDDMNHKDVSCKRDMDVGFAGSIDSCRYSIFYLRYLFAREIAKKYNNSLMSNVIRYSNLIDMYSHSIVGWNDVARWTNMRCWEIPSAGAFMLVNDKIRDTDFPLKEDKHYMVYDDVTDCLKKLEYLLDDKEGTIKMGSKARKEALKHPMSKSIKEMIKKCNLNTLT